MKFLPPGQPISKIPGGTWNEMVATTQKVQAFLNSGGGAVKYSNVMPGYVPIYNASGSDLMSRSVIGISHPLIDSAANEAEFKNNLVLYGIAPAINTHWRRYAVTIEAIPNGKIGMCQVAGFAIVKVKVVQDWHQFATITEDYEFIDPLRRYYLQSAPSGDAIICWTIGIHGGSEDWALVNIKSGDAVVNWGAATTNWNSAADNGCYVVVNPCADKDGTDTDAGSDVKVWLPRNGRDLDPNIVSGAIIPYHVTAPEAATPEAVCIGDYLDGKIAVSYKLIVADTLDPDGWEAVTDADGKTVTFNNNPTETGYDTHGGDTNDHDDHAYDLSHDVNNNLTFTPSLSSHKFPHWDTIFPETDNLEDVLTAEGIDVSGVGNQVLAEGGSIGGDLTVDNHTGSFAHSETSNWPPYFRLKIIVRSDNSV